MSNPDWTSDYKTFADHLAASGWVQKADLESVSCAAAAFEQSAIRFGWDKAVKAVTKALGRLR